MNAFFRRTILTVFIVSAVIIVPAAAQELTPAPSGWLGVGLADAPAPKEGGAPSPSRGVLINSIVDDGPAERAGLREGDKLIAVDGMEVQSPSDLIARIRKLLPGTWVDLTLERRGTSRHVQVQLLERPADPGELKMRSGWLGVRTIELPPTLRSHFGAPEDRGVMVSDVVDGSPAESAGLRVGDVVYEIEGEPVRSSGELSERVSRAGVGNTVELSAARDGAKLTLEALVVKRPDAPPPQGQMPPARRYPTPADRDSQR